MRKKDTEKVERIEGERIKEKNKVNGERGLSTPIGTDCRLQEGGAGHLWLIKLLDRWITNLEGD